MLEADDDTRHPWNNVTIQILNSMFDSRSDYSDRNSNSSSSSNSNSNSKTKNCDIVIAMKKSYIIIILKEDFCNNNQ